MPPRKQDAAEVYISLKRGRTTTFVLTTLSTPFRTIVADLLVGLAARYPNGIPSGPEESSSNLHIPVHPYQVRLAKLHDNTNSDKGWSEIPWLKYEDDKLKIFPRAWEIEGGAKLAFTFTKNEEEVKTLRGLGEEDEAALIEKEATDFWVEWPNFEWMDQEEEEEETAKRLREEEEDVDAPLREKRRRVVDDEDSDEGSEGQLNGEYIAAIA